MDAASGVQQLVKTCSMDAKKKGSDDCSKSSNGDAGYILRRIDGRRVGSFSAHCGS